MLQIVLILVVVVIATAFYLQTLQTQKSSQPSSNSIEKEADVSYVLRPLLFTPAERKFYNALSAAVASDQIVFGKVRVADILQPNSEASRSQWQSAFNRISSKHFDYVICDRATLSIQTVVELQDKSHAKSNRIKRDQFLRKACQSAGLPLIEFKAKADYATDEIRAAL